MTTDEAAGTTSVHEHRSKRRDTEVTRADGDAPVDSQDKTGSTIAWPELLVLIGLVVVGAVIRAHGFTNLDLWFDDAWAAAPARVGLSKAIHMVLTAPGYGLALRSWLRLDPTTTWFGQLPAFVLSLAAIPAVFGLIRFFRFPRWIALGAATLVAMGPLTVQYATRLKEYPFDLLACCALLVLAERVRRTPSPRRLIELAVASVVLFFMSAGSVPVIAAVWLTLGLALLGDGRARRRLVTCAGAAAAGCAVVWVVFLRHIPPVLSVNWRRRGYLMDYRSLGAAERTATLILGGFFHAVLGYPVPVNFFENARGPHAPSVAVLGALLLVVAIGVPVVGSIRRRRILPTLPAAMTLLCALVLAAVDRVPLGDGRTDEVLYPALFVCLAAVVAAATPLARRVVPVGRPARLFSIALAVALLAGAVAFGVAHPAKYPTISLRGVEARLGPLEHPGDVVFVDTFNSFAWCYYELSACRTQVGGTPPWPQGFRPVSISTAPSVFIASHYGIPLPELTAAQARAKRIWYVGYTYGTYDVGTDPARYNVPVVPTYMTGLLKADGWRPAPAGPTTEVLGVHAYALLLVRSHPR